ncbi:ChbG/HpnK family deacetylase [Paenibacillus luteus]|uniref:ChbG/HpnK family deacetylase n=1 Tax=Paenibacillus luteus TaxID=2545753 RepID=UPI0013758DD2|nr:ChbG/HpnK family deacetylase [Paenibacillus luteus]
MTEKLGYSANERLLIIHADDFGLTRETNEAILQSFEHRTITSAYVMMPCAAASEAIGLSIQRGKDDIGIHLSLTSDESGFSVQVSLLKLFDASHADWDILELSLKRE